MKCNGCNKELKGTDCQAERLYGNKAILTCNHCGEPVMFSSRTALESLYAVGGYGWDKKCPACLIGRGECVCHVELGENGAA